MSIYLPKNKNYKKPKLYYFSNSKKTKRNKEIENTKKEKKNYNEIIYNNYLFCNINNEHNKTEISDNIINISSFYFNSKDDTKIVLYPFYNKKIELEIPNQILTITIYNQDKEYISYGYFYKNNKELYVIDLLMKENLSLSNKEYDIIEEIKNKKNFKYLNDLPFCIFECKINLK